MLNFLRKYQKLIFGCVTGALIISIVFFGSYGALSNIPKEEKDVVIGTALDGSKVSKQFIEKMGRFLCTDQQDSDVRFSGRVPNYFNNGVIKQDFIHTGFAKPLAAHYFDFLKKELEERVEKQKKFKGYQHPAAPFISAESLWSQMLPSLGRDLATIRSKDFILTKENLDVLFHLYEESAHFSTDLLRQFLGYQQERYEWISKDPYLSQGDLSLFHFHDIEDWFGPTFNQMICQSIHNIALFAKQKGYKVSEQEAKAHLFKTGYEALSTHSSEKVTNPLLAQAWQQVLLSCRVTEREAIKIWQEVLLCKKVFEEEKQAVLVDRLCDADFASFASEGKEIKLYSLPVEFQFKDFLSLMKFQVYIETVAKNKKETVSSDLPKEYKTKEEISKIAPELLVESYECIIKHVKASDLLENLSYKALIDWQSKHVGELKVAFEELALISSQHDPLDALDRLDNTTRSKVDQYSLRQILKENPTLIFSALEEKKGEKKELTTTIKQDEINLEGILEPHKIISLLREKKEGEPLVIERYTQDKEHFYTIDVLSISKEPELLTYKKAKEMGVLDKMLEAKLKKHFEVAKAQQPQLFVNEKGETKSFESVKEVIGAHYFKDLLDHLDKIASKDFKAKSGYSHYCDVRLLGFVQKAKEDIFKQKSHSPYLDPQLFCHLNVKEEKIKRKDATPLAKEELFELKEGMISSIVTPSKGDICFYEVIKTLSTDEQDIALAIERKQKLLGEQAQKKLISELTKQMIEKECLHLEEAQR